MLAVVPFGKFLLGKEKPKSEPKLDPKLMKALREKSERLVGHIVQPGETFPDGPFPQVLLVGLIWKREEKSFEDSRDEARWRIEVFTSNPNMEKVLTGGMGWIFPAMDSFKRVHRFELVGSDACCIVSWKQQKEWERRWNAKQESKK